MDLSNLHAAAGSAHSDNFRRGRGHGSGNGKTSLIIWISISLVQLYKQE